MNPAEAVQAHLDLGASASIGMHFGTFQMTTEGIDEPLLAVDEARRARNISPSQFRTLRFGESVRPGSRQMTLKRERHPITRRDPGWAARGSVAPLTHARQLEKARR
jgi:hypothetical protein